MGNYTGVATRLKVKKTAPSELLQFLDETYYIVPESENRSMIFLGDQSKEIERLVSVVTSMVLCSSSYFDAWNWRVKEDRGNYWLYESRASSKRAYLDVFEMLLNGIREHLVLEEGDILLRTIYEEATVESIIFFTNDTFKQRDGFRYRSEHGYIGGDSRHPYNFEHGEEIERKMESGELSHNQRYEEEYTPPWNIVALDKAIEEEKKALSKRSHNSYGFS